MMKNRYIFFKRIFKNYVILFKKQNKYYSLEIDYLLMTFIGKKNLNYILIDEKNNDKIITFSVNNYNYYVFKIFLDKLLEMYMAKF